MLRATTALVRLPFAALVLYVALDCANPLMPGAVCFDPAASVEAVAGARTLPRVTLGSAAAPPEAVPCGVAEPRLGRRGIVPVHTAASARGTAPRARSALLRPSDPGPEDH
jgi:hypothetical protein